MQTQIIFVLATFAYFASIVYVTTPGIQPFTHTTTILLLCLGLSAGYMILTKTLNAGGLSYLALAVLYGTVFLGFVIIYSLFMVADPLSSSSGTYETIVSQPTDISSNTINATISKYKNAASPLYTLDFSIKLTNLHTDFGTIFERPGLLKVEIVDNGQLNILTSSTSIIIDAATAKLSATQYVPYTFVIQPNTLNVYRDGKLIKSVATPMKPPTINNTTIVIGKVNGGSLDVFRYSDTNILYF